MPGRAPVRDHADDLRTPRLWIEDFQRCGHQAQVPVRLEAVDADRVVEGLLRESRGLGLTFALQGPDQFHAYLEDTTTASRLMLRLPVVMTGRFIDVDTGVLLGELTVEPALATARPTRVAVPAGHRAVILQLRARD